MSQDFLIGWFAGIVSAIPIGFVFRSILVNWNRTTSPSRKQKVLHSTDKSPWQVQKDAFVGFLMFLFWTSLLLAGLYFGSQWLINQM
jgi:hypothetical protein